MSKVKTLLIGSNTEPVATLGAELKANRHTIPSLAGIENDSWPWADALQQWRETVAGGEQADRIVVMIWPDHGHKTPCSDTDFLAWSRRAEAPLAQWFAALGCAQQLCSDGGSVVALVERPAPLDSTGRAPEVAVAEGVVALVRSLAKSEGARGARFNAVTTPLRLSPEKLVNPAPALASYPGQLLREVIGSVRMMLGDDSCGVTGSVVHADCGRSW